MYSCSTAASFASTLQGERGLHTPAPFPLTSPFPRLSTAHGINPLLACIRISLFYTLQCTLLCIWLSLIPCGLLLLPFLRGVLCLFKKGVRAYYGVLWICIICTKNHKTVYIHYFSCYFSNVLTHHQVLQ